jgi:hypothetical protein
LKGCRIGRCVSDCVLRNEHTRIESYPQQIADGQHFIALLEPLESELAGKLPEGRYGLVIDSRAAGKVSSSASPRVRAAVKEWVLQNAPILEAKRHSRRDEASSVRATPPQACRFL